ncbi:MAG: hypothetical protein R3253_09310 [Longimicrobiales bacterium]|nr:hypothetical protein [Longimicrobiales bacterium]
MPRVVGVLMALGTAFPTPGAAQMEWRLSSLPTLTVGDVPSPGHQLFRVADATRLPDGRLVVLNAGTSEIRIFSPSGDLAEVVGGEGDGPGEYQSLSAIRRDRSGGFWVYDWSAARATHLDRDFEVIETRRVGYDLGAGIPVPSRFRPFEDGAIPIARGVLTMMEHHARRPGHYHDTIRVGVHHDGALREVFKLSRGETFGVRVGSSGITRPIPFGETALYGAGPTSFVVGTSHSREFQVLDRRGRVLRTVQAGGQDRRVTRLDWELFQEAFREQYEGGMRIRGVAIEREPFVDEFLARTPRGRDFPLFDAAQIDGMGRVWVREYSLGAQGRTWQALGEEGVIALLDIPAEWEVLEFGEAYVVVLLKDEFDVESLRVYQIVQ